MNTVYIVDDEPLARKRIRNLLMGYHSLEVVGESGEFQQAVEQINEKKPEILFLDIQLKAKKGFRILELIEYLPLTIFTTAYSEYAVKAFEYHAIDYLLKPFNDERFHHSVSRAVGLIREKKTAWKDKMLDFLENVQLEEKHATARYLVRIPVRIAETIHFVETSHIRYIKASAYYAELFAENGKHIIRESLSSLMKQLDPSVFTRVHRSSIINLNYLKEISSIGYGDLELTMQDGQKIRVSKSYKQDLIEKLRLK